MCEEVLTVIYLLIPISLIFGFSVGLLLFKVKQRWCRTCGGQLRCVRCLYQAGKLTELLSRPLGGR